MKFETKATLTDSDYGRLIPGAPQRWASAIYSIYKKPPCNTVLVTGGISSYDQASSLAPELITINFSCL